MHRLIILFLALAVASCSKKTATYETKIVLQSKEIVRHDAKGGAAAVEVSVEYTDCPGEQAETLQGNAEFASCMAKYKLGDSLKATVVHAPTPDGHYDSEIEKLGDCARHRDPRDARSYEVVQVCEDVVVNGVVVGFHCDRKPTKDLLAKCPWFARK
jgi:hypothetical protein